MSLPYLRSPVLLGQVYRILIQTFSVVEKGRNPTVSDGILVSTLKTETETVGTGKGRQRVSLGGLKRYFKFKRFHTGLGGTWWIETYCEWNDLDSENKVSPRVSRWPTRTRVRSILKGGFNGKEGKGRDAHVNDLPTIKRCRVSTKPMAVESILVVFTGLINSFLRSNSRKTLYVKDGSYLIFTSTLPFSLQ